MCVLFASIECLTVGLLGGENDTNNQTVQTEGLSENKNKNHRDEQLRLATVGTHTCVTDNTNSKTSACV